MFKHINKKIAFFLFAITCGAAYAYPPYCTLYCKAEGYRVGTPEYSSCLSACNIACNAGQCPA